jgi:hypothetical protein
MNLSEAQMNAMSEVAAQGFERRLFAHLRETFGERLVPLNDEQLALAVSACCEKAHGHGIDLQDDVRRYTEFAVLYGLTMDGVKKAAWIGAVLRMEDLSGTERMNLLDAIEPSFFRGVS